MAIIKRTRQDKRTKLNLFELYCGDKLKVKPTFDENEMFKIMRLFSSNYKNEKQKATDDFSHLSPFVGMRRLERPTPTSRT